MKSVFELKLKKEDRVIPVNVEISNGNIQVSISQNIPESEQEICVDLLRKDADDTLQQVQDGLEKAGVRIKKGKIVNDVTYDGLPTGPIQKNDPRLDQQFLDTLVACAKTCGWLPNAHLSDKYAMEFIQAVFKLAGDGIEKPDLTPYTEEEQKTVN